MRNTIKELSGWIAALSLIILLSGVHTLNATHIVGGQLSFRCLGGSQYELTLQFRRDCFLGNPEADFDDPAAIWVYDGDFRPVMNVGAGGVLRMSLDESDTLRTIFPGACFGGGRDVCVQTATYVDTFNLPRRPGGYHLMYQRCCRNSILDNIQDPLETGSSYIIRITEESLETCNSAPILGSFPPVYACINQQLIVDQGGTDLEGDSIVYKLCTPYVGATKDDPNPDVVGIHPDFPANVSWVTPTYDVDHMLGNENSPLQINPQTGNLIGLPEIQGTFLVGICIEEYRNGVLLSTMIRDFEVTTRSCLDNPVADFGPSGLYCDGVEVDFDNQSVNATNFKWFFDLDGDTTLQSTEENPVFIYPDTGTYTVMLIATEDSICIDTTIKTLRVFRSGLVPDFEFSVNKCSDTIELELTDLSSDSINSIVNRNWTIEIGDSVYTATGTNPIFYLTQEGLVTITLEIIDGNGCSESITQELEVQRINIDLIGDSLSICLRDTTSLLNSANNNLSYTWTPDIGLSDNTAPNPDAYPDSNITYYVEVTDGFCTVNDSVFVEVRGSEFEVINITIDQCAPEQICTVNGVEVDSIIWSTDPGFDTVISNNDTIRIIVLDSTTLYTRVYSDSIMCVLEGSITLVSQGVQAVYPDSMILCINDTVTFTLNDTSGQNISVSWEPNPIIIDGLDSTTVTLYKDVLEDDILIFTVVNDSGCVLTDSIYIKAQEEMLADFTFEKECGSLTVEFTNQSEPGMWQWDFGDGETSMQDNPVHTYDSDGVYTVTISAMDACMSSFSQTITVDTIITNIQDTMIVCANQPVELNPGGNPNYTYNWSPAEFLDDATIANPTAIVDETTLFTVDIVGDLDTCTLTKEVLVIVEDLFILTSDDSLICEGDTVKLTASPQTGRDVSWDWEPKDVIITDPTMNMVRAVVDETTTFIVTATTPNGCIQTDSITIVVEQLDPNVMAIADPPTIEFGEDGRLDVIGGLDEWMYTWRPGEGLMDSTDKSPLVLDPRDTTNYTVTIKTDNGCLFELSTTLNVIQPPCERPYIFLPNAFSPNNDGQNDVLYVRGEFIDQMELLIYNRLGEQVFRSTNKDIGWDGLTNGEENTPAAFGYYLMVTCEGGGTLTEKGSVSIIK